MIVGVSAAVLALTSPLAGATTHPSNVFSPKGQMDSTTFAGRTISVLRSATDGTYALAISNGQPGDNVYADASGQGLPVENSAVSIPPGQTSALSGQFTLPVFYPSVRGNLADSTKIPTWAPKWEG
ncbi:hypothetical protein HUW46_06213 [Amycolatopsis sp. CA-230715]|nr:hypothetical protein HUW46_06213 [Amycolatopsis sp. CA-230715]